MRGMPLINGLDNLLLWLKCNIGEGRERAGFMEARRKRWGLNKEAEKRRKKKEQG